MLSSKFLQPAWQDIVVETAWCGCLQELWPSRGLRPDTGDKTGKACCLLIGTHLCPGSEWPKCYQLVSFPNDICGVDILIFKKYWKTEDQGKETFCP